MPKKESTDKSKNQSKAKARIKRTEAYAQKVKQEFSEAVNSILALKKKKPNLADGVMYSFDGDTKKVQGKVTEILRKLHSATVTSIQNGIEQEWSTANKEVDDLLASTLGKSIFANPNLAGWFDRNEKAMTAFAKRTENGFNLSNSIWRDTQQLREEMEVAMTVAIGEGQSASQISRKVRQYLNDPDLMFRRFRYKDENGKWRKKWKKRVRDDNGKVHFIDYDKNSYKTGAGVYKSSYRNAMRVARTETNMAYRRADNDRWSRLDFVLGQHIELSRSHPKEDICDELQGDYPKDFLFEGWHPQCFCICTSILPSEEEMEKRLEAAVKGEEYTPTYKPITTYPKGFQKFIERNADNIKEAMNKGTAPYFVVNNQKVVQRMFKGEDLTGAGETDAKTPQEILEEIQKTYSVYLPGYDEEDAFKKEAIWKFDFAGMHDAMNEIGEKYGIGRLMGSVAVRADEDDFTFTVKFSAGKRRDFTLTRVFKPIEGGGINVDHEFFEINKHNQGKGVSKEVFRLWYEQYKKMGVTQISVQANIDVGGYTWARYGFCAKQEHAIRAMGMARANRNLRERGVQIIEDFYSKEENQGKPFPMNNIVREMGKDDAKELLLGSNWYGAIDLTDKEQRDVFEKYLGL